MAHYQVVSGSSAEVALARLEELKAAGADVPLVLAGQRLPGMSGTELLARVRGSFPTRPARAFDLLGVTGRRLRRSWRRRRLGSWSFT